MTPKKYQSVFEKDVLEGLSRKLKHLPSKYFYDDEGSRLFQKIMRLEEYYLPRLEMEIIKNQTVNIIRTINQEPIDILELGAGDGAKTVEFLNIVSDCGISFTYYPFDISQETLNANQSVIKKRLPNLKTQGVVGDYFQTLSEFRKSPTTKLVLYLGSNIGNFQFEEAVSFVKHICENLQVGDYLLVGADLRKNPKTVLAAYNDSQGVTKEFNLNILRRINRELGASFDLKKYDHYPFYEPILGITYSYLISLDNQLVTFANGQEFYFFEDELIHTEISKKYWMAEINELFNKGGFSEPIHFFDSTVGYTLSLSRKS